MYNQLHLPAHTPAVYTVCFKLSPLPALAPESSCLKAHPRFANSYLPFRSQQSARDEGRKEQGTNGKCVLPTPGFWRPSYMPYKGISCKVPAFGNKPQASAAQKPRSLFSFNRCILSTSFMLGHCARRMRYNREWNKKEPYPKRT